MIGAHWPALLAPLAGNRAPAAAKSPLERALAATGAVAWEWDVSAGTRHLTAGTAVRPALRDDPADGFVVVHPDDRAWLKQAVTEAASGDRRYDFEFRLLRPDGTVEWVRDRGQLERDANGQPWRLAGVAQLVTAQKRAEAALHATFEQAVVGMAHVALDGTLLKVNDCLCRILGRPREALLGLGFQELTHPDDLDADRTPAAALLAGRIATYSVEKRYRHGNGGIVRATLTLSLVRDAGGAPDYFMAVVEAPPKRGTPAAEPEVEALARGLMQASPDCIKFLDAEGRILDMNATGLRALGIDDVGAIRGRAWETIWPEDARPRVRRCVRNAAGRIEQFTECRQGPSGATHWWDSEIWPMPGGDRRLIGISRDVTHARQLVAALAEAQANYWQFIEHVPVEVAVFDTEMRYIAASRRYLAAHELDAYADGAIAGQRHDEILPDAPEGWREFHRRVMAGESITKDNDRILRSDGRYDLIRWQMVPWRRQDGSIGGSLLFIEVVTERRLAEQALAESETRFRGTFEQAAVGMAHVGLDGQWQRVNQRLCEILGYAEQELLARTFQDITHPDDLEADLHQVRALIAGDIATYTMEKRYVRKGGRVIWANLTVSLLRGADGQPRHFISVVEDISGRKAIEAELRHSNARFRNFVDAMPQMAFVTRPDGYNEFQNRRWSDYTGIPQDESIGERWAEVLHPEDRDRTLATWKAALETGEIYRIEHRLRGADGGYRWFLTRAMPLRGGDTGEIRQWLGTSTDISEIVAAREVLAKSKAELETLVGERTRVLADAARKLAAEMQRPEEMQAMLLQTRKLEALGQLTGGVAHDFNNVLTAITGTYGLIRRRTDSPVVHDLVSRGERAVERAANLTRQLLTFARKQDLCPAALDLSTMLRDAEDMVRHAIISSIRYTREIPPDIWPVLADRQQLEVALLNLAVNARDAMLDGGTLTIAARNLNAAARPAHLPARDYVAIAVRDTGTGMPPEIISRVIEPFFTTKEQGKGTGLGLAMVNGFAEQSGGCLRIESAPGSGTTIEIILPRADRPVAENDGRGESVLDSMLHGDATILVVDDDEPVRTTIAGLLRDLGYTVIEARNAEVAQVLVHTLARLDLVITDVMMPGATGPVLAAKLRAEHPALPILFVTGHSFNESLAGEAVLAKPFTEQALAAAVLERLGRRPAANASPSPGGAFVSHLRTQPLREAYLAWMRMQMGGRLPRPDDVDPVQFGLGPDACWVAVDAMSPAPAFRFLEVGQALQARLGRPLEGEAAGDGQPGDEELGALIAAYRRCASQKVPVYQSAHYDFSDGEPVRFHRLVLPFSADTLNVTHLLALVQFEGRVS